MVKLHNFKYYVSTAISLDYISTKSSNKFQLMCLSDVKLHWLFLLYHILTKPNLKRWRCNSSTTPVWNLLDFFKVCNVIIERVLLFYNSNPKILLNSLTIIKYISGRKPIFFLLNNLLCQGIFISVVYHCRSHQKGYEICTSFFVPQKFVIYYPIPSHSCLENTLP